MVSYLRGSVIGAIIGWGQTSGSYFPTGPNQKIEDWLRAGVKLVWVIDPDAKVVFCHEPTAVATRREADTLTGDPVLPGFAVPVAELFRLAGSVGA